MPQWNVSVKMEGADEVVRALKALGPKAATVGAGAIYREANDIMNASLDIVPVDKGDLKGTGKAWPPEIDGSKAVCILSYGDASVDYAVVQHETPPTVFRHNEGQTWKYLERPAFEATRGMGQRIAGYIRERLEREPP